MTGEVPEIKETNVEGGGITRFLLFGIVTVIIALFIARFISRYVFGAIGVYSRHRHTLLLIGLCGSGKTTLFAQLVAQKCVSARTSMQPNRAIMTRRQLPSHKEEKEEEKSSFSSPSRVSNGANASQVVVDFPGHRRLRDSLLSAIEEAMSVVVVVDAVTIQDDRQEGAQALAELIFSVFTSSAFYGVQRVLVACTKRDELTSYSAKAVRKLLEAEITRFVTSRRGDLQSLDTILNSARVVVGQKKSKFAVGGGSSSSRRDGPTHQLSLDESGKFTFDNFPIPVHFADVSSVVDPARHPFNVEPVWDFVEGRM
ncbi:hypothetical protein MOQ_009645 [Trypanosoma cruzi marinkellei]|uniref:Signal recognition particle receptor subunit beta n=1 Tax=Trypanosoma cruzi marinkellei TaxID=85056 RepID=K2MHS0_TRYCR|nr:hypothetical protein MOQ_009645 [Trypanosoma cruzi marinkellei]